MYRLSNEDLDYKTLSINNKEYIVAKTQKSQEPLVIKPNIVDSFLRDKNGNINEKILCVRGNCDTEVDQMVLKFPILADYAVLCENNRLIYLTHGREADKNKHQYF